MWHGVAWWPLFSLPPLCAATGRDVVTLFARAHTDAREIVELALGKHVSGLHAAAHQRGHSLSSLVARRLKSVQTTLALVRHISDHSISVRKDTKAQPAPPWLGLPPLPRRPPRPPCQSGRATTVSQIRDNGADTDGDLFLYWRAGRDALNMRMPTPSRRSASTASLKVPLTTFVANLAQGTALTVLSVCAKLVEPSPHGIPRSGCAAP